MNSYLHLWMYLAELFLEREIFQKKICRANQNTHFIFKRFFFFRKSCPLWDNVEKYSTERKDINYSIILCMRFVCWISKATDTHSEYVIFIAFPLQQWLYERASVWRCTYIALLFLVASGCWLSMLINKNCYFFIFVPCIFCNVKILLPTNVLFI